jgi:hypothetical protein
MVSGMKSRGGLVLDELDRDPAAGAGLVLDDHRLADIVGELLADQPREQVVAAAGREPHDHPDRPGRIVGLRPCRGGRRAEGCERK